MDDVPIACTLERGKRKQPPAPIARFSGEALEPSRDDALKLTLDYAPDAIGDVRDMVAAEQRCCALVDFGIEERADRVSVTIFVAERARQAADALFKRFVSPAPASPNRPCGCKGECGA